MQRCRERRTTRQNEGIERRQIGVHRVDLALDQAVQRSGRTGPFVAVNCGTFTEGLLASDLFGHVRGAFTGAVADQQGLFRAARGGKLLLDEVAEIPMALQATLLRVLEMREVEATASALRLKIATLEIRRAEDIAPAFDALKGRAEFQIVFGESAACT